jgi:pilus assembly protein CpaB
MKLRGVLVLLLSLVLAGVAAVSANRWMASRLAGGAGGPLSGVVAAAAEIPFGTKIDATLIKMVQLPPEAVPATAFRDPQAVIGRIAAGTLYKGEVLMDGRVVEHVGGSALAAVVEEGKRAVTVRVNDVIGVAGFLLPGNRVDVISTRRKSGGEHGMEAQTLLQNLKVLAVDQSTSPEKNQPVIVRAVTVEVDPAQAEQIVGATEEGKVQLTLRNPLDGMRREPKPEPTAQGPVAATVSLPPTAPVIDRNEVVVVIRGTKWADATREPPAKVLAATPETKQPPPTDSLP